MIRNQKVGGSIPPIGFLLLSDHRSFILYHHFLKSLDHQLLRIGLFRSGQYLNAYHLTPAIVI